MSGLCLECRKKFSIARPKISKFFILAQTRRARGPDPQPTVRPWSRSEERRAGKEHTARAEVMDHRERHVPCRVQGPTTLLTRAYCEQGHLNCPLEFPIQFGPTTILPRPPHMSRRDRLAGR